MPSMTAVRCMIAARCAHDRRAAHSWRYAPSQATRPAAARARAGRRRARPPSCGSAARLGARGKAGKRIGRCNGGIATRRGADAQRGGEEGVPSGLQERERKDAPMLG
eukprot:6185851-Pleurochrysis_carterae.AAC.2